jgi:hypothetical protein
MTFFVLVLPFSLHWNVGPFHIRIFAHHLPKLAQCASHGGFALDKAVGRAFKVVEEIGSE